MNLQGLIWKAIVYTFHRTREACPKVILTLAKGNQEPKNENFHND